MGQIAADIKTSVPGSAVWWDGLTSIGDNLAATARSELESSNIVVAFVGKHALISKSTRDEWSMTKKFKLDVIPVLIGIDDHAAWFVLPDHLRNIRSEALPVPKKWTSETLKPLLSAIRQKTEQLPHVPVVPEDPNRGQFGGKSTSKGRELTATVRRVSADWFRVVLTVRRTSGAALKGQVEFHLHPTFAARVETVDVKRGVATLELHAWGAFTVGAILDDRETRLELDLATLADAPQEFRER